MLASSKKKWGAYLKLTKKALLQSRYICTVTGNAYKAN